MTHARRFGIGVTSLPLRLRIALTAPVVFVNVVLLQSLYFDASADDPRPAALVLFLLGAVNGVAIPVLRELWRRNAEWAREQARQAADELDVADRARTKKGLAHLADLTAPPVSGAAE